MNKNNQTIKIQRVWLESLIEHKKKAEYDITNLSMEEMTFLLKFNIPPLLGYIESTKYMLK